MSDQIHLSQRDELPLLYIQNDRASAVIALQGAQLLSYQRHGSHPLIWCSEQAAYQRGQSIRGGIPVCWPWFGDLARNPESIRNQFILDTAPAHGLVRGESWLLENIEATGEYTRIALRYPTARGLELRIAITVGDTLNIELGTTNSNDHEISFSQALHTYFAVGNIHNTRVTGLENTRYIETLENWTEKKQQGAITFSGETDRIYVDTPDLITIEDPEWQRRIYLHTRNSKSAVVWNPWIEKSKRLSQFGTDAWQQMLCIESANVMADSVTLSPAQSHRLSLEISELGSL